MLVGRLIERALQILPDRHRRVVAPFFNSACFKRIQRTSAELAAALIELRGRLIEKIVVPVNRRRGQIGLRIARGGLRNSIPVGRCRKHQAAVGQNVAGLRQERSIAWIPFNARVRERHGTVRVRRIIRRQRAVQGRHAARRRLIGRAERGERHRRRSGLLKVRLPNGALGDELDGGRVARCRSFPGSTSLS